MSHNIKMMMRTLSPALFLAGSFLLVTAGGLWYIQQELSPLPKAMLFASLAVIAAAGAARLASLLTASPRRQMWGKLAVIGGTASMVIGFAGVNVFAHLPIIRQDFTRHQSHTLGPKTVAAITRMKETVHFSGLFPGNPPDHVEDLFEEFTRVAGAKIVTEIFDPLENLGRAAQFGTRVDGSEYRVVVWTKPDDGSVGRRDEIMCKETPLTEDHLTAAILRVTQGTRKAYFLTGHGELDIDVIKEGGLSQLKTALGLQNMECEKLMLGGVSEVPRDADALVIVGPQHELDPEETVKIRHFLDEGGHLLLMSRGALRTPPGVRSPDPGVTHPDFKDLLKDWHVALGDDVVVDMKNHLGQDVGCPAVHQYPPHDKIVANLGITFYVRPRSVRMLNTAPPDLLRAPLVQTVSPKESTWAETDKDLVVKYDTGVDLPGPVTLAAVMVRPTGVATVGGKSLRSEAAKLVVFGSSTFITNELVERYSNLDMIVNCITWLSDREPLLASRLQAPRFEPLQMTQRELRIALVVIVLIPALLMTIGLGVWWRREGFDTRQGFLG